MVQDCRYCELMVSAVDRRTFTLLEEIKAQGHTTILLFQQLVSRSLAGGELDMGPLPEGLTLPLSEIQEIDQLDVLVEDSDVKAKVVCIDKSVIKVCE